jgi:hypothetical protein
VIQLQGDHRIKIRDFLVNEETGLGLDEKNIKVRILSQLSTPLLLANLLISSLQIHGF